MARETTLDKYRNIGIMAHIDAGKTTTTERILYYTGKSHKMGEVHDGAATMDWMEQEQERGITITSAATTCFWQRHGASTDGGDGPEYRINIIDTPGSPDFIGKSISSLPAVETVAVMIDANAGIEVVTRRVMKIARERNLPRMIIINKIDNAPDLLELVEGIREAFGSECQPINLPADGGKKIVDCFQTASGDSDLGDIADALCASVDPPAADVDALRLRIDDTAQDDALDLLQRARWADGDARVARDALRRAFARGVRLRAAGRDARVDEPLPPLYPPA